MRALTLSIVLSLWLSSSSGGSARSSPHTLIQSTAQQIGKQLLPLVSSQVKYRTYTNARFNYSVSYPASLLVPQGEAENGDGQAFRSRDGKAEMRVFGRYNALNETLRSAFDAAIKGEDSSGRVVTYKTIKGNFYVVSGRQNGKIFYEKTYLKSDTFKTFMIEYDESESATYDAITARIARSFTG